MERVMKGKQSLKKRMWKPEEDMLLKTYVEIHGEGNWSSVSKKLGLQRGGKSCRLRWKNYLRPDIKHGGMSKDEEDLILRMHKLIGNRWSLIAGRLPGRTDNEVKNYWNTHLSKRANRLSKRKAAEVDENQEEETQKRAKMMMGLEQSSGQEPHVGSPKEPTHEASTVDLIGDEINFRSDIGLSKEDDKWSCLTGEVLAGTGPGTLGCGAMGMDFGFGLGHEEIAAWDHAGYVFFDAFGINWDETLPPP